MTVSTFSVPAALVSTSGVTSPSVLLSSNIVDVYIELTETGTIDGWALKLNTGYFTFGSEYSTDGGVNFRWLCHIPGDGADSSQLWIGKLRAKDGGMPDCGITASLLAQAAGSRVRLRALTIPIPGSVLPSPTVRVGAHLTVTSVP